MVDTCHRQEEFLVRGGEMEDDLGGGQAGKAPEEEQRPLYCAAPSLVQMPNFQSRDGKPWAGCCLKLKNTKLLSLHEAELC